MFLAVAEIGVRGGVMRVEMATGVVDVIAHCF